MSNVQTDSSQGATSLLGTEQCGILSINDNKVQVTAYAYDAEKGNLPLFVSIGGTKQVITAIRAAFGVGHQITAELGGRAIQWKPVKSMYSTIAVAPIIQVNQQHMIIAHTCLNGQMVGDDLYVMLPSNVENIPKAVLKRAEPFALIPMFPAWVPFLWERARENKLVTSMNSAGLEVYRVRLDSTWAKIVKIGIENGKLKPLRECVDVPAVPDMPTLPPPLPDVPATAESENDG